MSTHLVDARTVGARLRPLLGIWALIVLFLHTACAGGSRNSPLTPQPTPKERATVPPGRAPSKAPPDTKGYFIPGIIAHEFEGLLFSEPEAIARVVETEVYEREVVARELRKIAQAYASPEDINDSQKTAPSKRLEKLLPTYRKPRHGPLIAERIGLKKLRECCPLFAEWLAKLEALGGQEVM